MGASHHGVPTPGDSPDLAKLLERFNNQLEGRAKREYSKGRLNANDEGDLACIITADVEKQRIILDFGKSLSWIAMTADEANHLINMLKDKVQALGVPVVVTI